MVETGRDQQMLTSIGPAILHDATRMSFRVRNRREEGNIPVCLQFRADLPNTCPDMSPEYVSRV